MIHHWLLLRASGVPIGFADVAGMAIRGTLKRPLVRALIASHQTGLAFEHRQLEAHLLAGGDVEGVVKAALALRKLGQTVAPADLLAVDLKDRRLPELVRAYARARERYPDLSFEEVMRRHLEGEDVIAAVDRGSFVPTRNGPVGA